MAATRIIPLHIKKGSTAEKSLAARLDYAENKLKTEGGEFISAYACNPKTAVQEWMLARSQYQFRTGSEPQNEVIAYQIRQSFKPGEITPELANKLGYELGMRFTKGKYPFIVSTHTDKAHIHNHIIFHAISTDCNKRFRNFYWSALTVQKISDLICLENGLSVIEPKPYNERTKRTVYPKNVYLRDEICADIDLAMMKKPKDFEELLRYLEELGYAIKRGKHTSIKKNGKIFIRFSSLREGYREEDLRAEMQGTKKRKRSFSLQIDIQAKLQEGKGAGYERWAKVFNLKQAAESLLYLQEHGIDNYDDLETLSADATDQFNTLSQEIKDCEARLSEIADLKKTIITYAKTRETYVAYRKSGYSKKFLAEHEQEITMHKAAKAKFDKLGLEKLPRVKDLSEEYGQVLAKKKAAYARYKDARRNMEDLLIAKKNVDILLSDDTAKKLRPEQNRG